MRSADGPPVKPGQATFAMFVRFTEAGSHDVFLVDVPETIITILYERAAVEFWTSVADAAPRPEEVGGPAGPESA